MKQFFKSMLALIAAFLCGYHANATGWPASYQGVMLQGFYWDSYSDTRWTNLESQADELSQYFSLIWVPNSAKSASGGMGYDPVYWFTNHTTKFGTESQLRSMIQTFKAKGTGIIADVVINHRSGKSNWTDFPAEVWNGQTWQIGLDGICCTDEVNRQSGQAHGTGAPDTGEDFDGSRDLDHTNANVQNNCKNYVKFLLSDLGYTGVRYDMSKGYGGQYTKIYNQYAKPQFSVGEYWDGSYDALAAWIEATGKESAAFDFAFKYAVNKAFSSNDMTQLVWKANGTTNQPAGLIHYGYAQYAVTFIDNHDTSRDDWNKFNGNVLAANAFMICSPGTPCVFLPHYKQYKSQIQAMIAVRNACGVTNTSAVNVLRADRDCYMAEVTGTKGKLVVKVGSAMASPSGYSDSDIKATGTDYCIWSKVGGIVPPDPTPNPGTTPAALYLIGNNCDWNTASSLALTKSGDTFTAKGVKLPAAASDTYSYFSFVTAQGASWDIVNGSDRYGAASKDELIKAGTAASFTLYPANVSASSANSWKVAAGTYDVTVDFSKNTVLLTGEGDNPNPNPDPTPDPTTVTVYWDNTAAKWATPHIHYWGSTASTWPGVAMTKAEGNVWKYTCPAGTTGCLFNAGDGDATKTQDFVAVNNHVYTAAGDQGVYQGGVIPNPDPTPGTDLYLVGEFNDWTPGDANYKFIQAGGKYTLTMPALTGEFKICGATWDLSFGGEGDIMDPTVTTAAAVLGDNTMWYGSSVNMMASDLTNVTLSFTWDGTAAEGTSIILNIASGTNPNPDPNPTPGTDLFLVGEFNDWTPGDTNYKFTQAGGKYTLTMPALTGEFKICGATWDLSFGGEGDIMDPTVTTAAAVLGDNTMWYGSSVNMMASDLTNVTLSFTWDGTAAEGTSIILNIASGTNPNPDPDPTPGTDLFLVGEFNDWTPGDANYKFAQKNGVYTLEMPALSGEFKICGATWDLSFGGEGDIMDPTVTTATAIIGENVMWYGSSVNMMANNLGSCTLSFTWDGTEAEGTSIILTITEGTNSIDDIEAECGKAEYYNLQGVRVLEPQRGIYIKVCGGKATKIAL